MTQPKFSRRHYRIIALAIKNSEEIHDLAVKLSGIFAEDNERFSLSKFAKATGIAL